MKLFKRMLVLSFLVMPFLMSAQITCEDGCTAYENKITGKWSCCCDAILVGGQCKTFGFESAVIGTIDPCEVGICHLFEVGPYWIFMELDPKGREVDQTTISTEKPKNTKGMLTFKHPVVVDYADHLYEFTLMNKEGRPSNERAAKVWEIKYKAYQEILGAYKQYIEDGLQGSSTSRNRK